jgi:hypothetical protein
VLPRQIFWSTALYTISVLHAAFVLPAPSGALIPNVPSIWQSKDNMQENMYPAAPSIVAVILVSYFRSFRFVNSGG